MAPAAGTATRAVELMAATVTDADALHAALPGLLRRLVGCGPVFAAAVDPTTLHFTRASRQDINDEAAAEFLAHETGIDDVVKFRALAAAPDPVGTLFHATGGAARDSARWRDVIEPLGWGDELRVALRDGGRTWGVLCLHRGRDDAPYDERDVAAVRTVVPALARALRRTALGTSAPGPGPAPGVMVLDETLRVRSMTGAAAEWLDLLGGVVAGVPILVASVAGLALTTGQPQLARTVIAGGRWVTVHASPLHGESVERVAVILEPAHPADALPVLAVVARLTPREVEVATAALGGLSDRAISRALRLSEHTVQDHLKSIYAKVGARGRGELVARLLAR
jgi:DNA-binding CsgD family transcriptional regulator